MYLLLLFFVWTLLNKQNQGANLKFLEELIVAITNARSPAWPLRPVSSLGTNVSTFSMKDKKKPDSWKAEILLPDEGGSLPPGKRSGQVFLHLKTTAECFLERHRNHNPLICYFALRCPFGGSNRNHCKCEGKTHRQTAFYSSLSALRKSTHFSICFREGLRKQHPWRNNCSLPPSCLLSQPSS